MEKLYELYDMLCEELEELTEKGELTAGSLEVAEKITETMKNIGKIADSDMYSGDYRHDMGSYDGSYERGGRSYERGRSGRSYARGGSYARRDSRGRYSREGGYSRHDIVEQLEDIMHSAPNEKSRKEIERLIMKMEQM